MMTTRVKIAVKSVALAVLLFFGAAAAGGDNVPRPVKMLNEAWDAYEQGNNAEAAASADKVINEFWAIARQRQKELLDKNTPPPPTGIVPPGEKDRIFKFGPLNDVAAAWYIKGRALAKMGRTKEALETLKRTAEYPYARVYDKDGGSFWSPAESARDWIAALQDQ